MINYIENRELKNNQKVKVYYNLHKHTFSIIDYKSNLLLAHSDVVKLKDVTFKVSRKGRQRVLKEQRKNVHAYVIGNYLGFNYKIEEEDLHNWNALCYNPYINNFFINKETNQPANNLYDFVICQNKKIYF